MLFWDLLPERMRQWPFQAAVFVCLLAFLSRETAIVPGIQTRLLSAPGRFSPGILIRSAAEADTWELRRQKHPTAPNTLSDICHDQLLQTVNSWNLILKWSHQSQQPPAHPGPCLHTPWAEECTPYPINLLQEQHGTVPAKVLWQYGVSLPARRGRHLSTEEAAVQSLCHQSQTKTRRPAKIQHT